MIVYGVVHPVLHHGDTNATWMADEAVARRLFTMVSRNCQHESRRLWGRVVTLYKAEVLENGACNPILDSLNHVFTSLEVLDRVAIRKPEQEEPLNRTDLVTLPEEILHEIMGDFEGMIDGEIGCLEDHGEDREARFSRRVCDRILEKLRKKWLEKPLVENIAPMSAVL